MSQNILEDRADRWHNYANILNYYILQFEKKSLTIDTKITT